MSPRILLEFGDIGWITSSGQDGAEGQNAFFPPTNRYVYFLGDETSSDFP